MRSTSGSMAIREILERIAVVFCTGKSLDCSSDYHPGKDFSISRRESQTEYAAGQSQVDVANRASVASWNPAFASELSHFCRNNCNWQATSNREGLANAPGSTGKIFCPGDQVCRTESPDHGKQIGSRLDTCKSCAGCISLRW